MTLLNTLAEQGRLWSARRWQETKIPAISSGHSTLDTVLPGQGWPLGAITEILYPAIGSGELRLLLPTLANMSQQDDRWQLWLNPPLPPCAPALQQWGVNIQRLLIAHAHKPADICHSIEKSLQSAGCQTAIVWLTTLDKALMRRIQLAAETAKVPVFMLRPLRFQQQPSVAAVRLRLHDNQRIDILKRRAGWPVNDIEISLSLHRRT